MCCDIVFICKFKVKCYLKNWVVSVTIILNFHFWQFEIHCEFTEASIKCPACISNSMTLKMHVKKESIKHYHYVVQLNSCSVFSPTLTFLFLDERQMPLQEFMQYRGLFILSWRQNFCTSFFFPPVIFCIFLR